jgi:CBS-domain-containing membrane protein
LIFLTAQHGNARDNHPNALRSDAAPEPAPTQRTRTDTTETVAPGMWRARLPVRKELALAVFPTMTVLGMLWVLEMFGHQRILFASLASSAFLIYLEPLHATNAVRTLTIAHTTAATFGLITWFILGHGYLAGGLAMILTILTMILANSVHPPAIATSLIFAIRSGTQGQLVLFLLALAIVIVLAMLQRSAVWLLNRLDIVD